MRIVFVLVLFFGMHKGSAQTAQKFVIEANLESEWTVFVNNQWIPWDGGAAKAIYFTRPSAYFRGKYAALKSSRPFQIFVNQQLIAGRSGGVILLNLDSLASRYSPGLSLAVYQEDGVDLRSAFLMKKIVSDGADQAIVPRKGYFFLDFTILAVLILSVSFILLFRTNPRLTLDYFNVARLFTVQEREDTLLTSRVTSSVNLLFYLFSSAFLGLNMLLIFYFGANEVNGAQYFQIYSVAGGFYQWMKLIVIIAGCFFIKLTIIYSFSTLFRLRDTSALQFFNFMRMTFFISVLISFISLGYFIFYGYPTGPDIGLLKLTLVVMTISATMIFLKLLSLAPFSFFHLFSYLCASEIIPLVIFLKILLY